MSIEWNTVGLCLRNHARTVQYVQWAVVLLYAVLLIVPACLPLPDDSTRIFNHLTVFAQFVFWGIWWPFVLLSIVLFGRLWCGVLCPEGALSEWAARHSVNRPIPRWMRWGGWPFVAFSCTTLYGQMISVYQYPKAALLILGGSTVAAMAVGLVYTRDKRVWCRYLCPVNGVFALLAKLAPFYYRVDEKAYRRSMQKNISIAAVNCAPLLPLRHMKGASACHMCGRCSGHRDAIELASRRFGEETLYLDEKDAPAWQSALILLGLMGVAIGAFHWSVSPWFIALKQSIAAYLIDKDILWPFSHSAPWWLLTHYPQQNEVFSWLDGALLLAYILATALTIGTLVAVALFLAVYFAGNGLIARFHQLAQSLIPIAACGVFLGLSALTVALLKIEGLALDWVSPLRLLLLMGANLWTLALAWRIFSLWNANTLNRLCGLSCVGLALAVADIAWGLMFWYWGG